MQKTKVSISKFNFSKTIVLYPFVFFFKLLFSPLIYAIGLAFSVLPPLASLRSLPFFGPPDCDPKGHFPLRALFT